METKFYICPICGNIIVKVKDSGVTPFCCGQEMETLTPKQTEGMGKEKHLPVVKKDGCKIRVDVGEIAHPMEEKHHIEFIALETENGINIRYTGKQQIACAEFDTCGEKPTAVYEYCNLHGLWKTKIG